MEEVLIRLHEFKSIEYRVFLEVYGSTIYDTLGDLITSAGFLKDLCLEKPNYNTDNLSRIVISKINAFRETFQNVLEILRGYYEESIKILQLNLVILTLIWMIILQIIYIIL